MINKNYLYLSHSLVLGTSECCFYACNSNHAESQSEKEQRREREDHNMKLNTIRMKLETFSTCQKLCTKSTAFHVLFHLKYVSSGLLTGIWFSRHTKYTQRIQWAFVLMWMHIIRCKNSDQHCSGGFIYNANAMLNGSACSQFIYFFFARVSIV